MMLSNGDNSIITVPPFVNDLLSSKFNDSIEDVNLHGDKILVLTNAELRIFIKKEGKYYNRHAFVPANDKNRLSLSENGFVIFANEDPDGNTTVKLLQHTQMDSDDFFRWMGIISKRYF